MHPTVTLLIYDQLDADLNYALVESDLSHLNGVVINGLSDQKLQDEAMDLIYEKDNGKVKISFSNDVSIIQGKKWDKVAVISFLP